jgi:hypothetical protein
MNRVLVPVLIAATVALGAPLAAHGAPTPVPASTAPAASTPATVPGYYLMHGSAIVSKPFENERACQKALAAIQRDLQPGNDTLVCAHRRP